MSALVKNYNRRKIAFKRGSGSFLYSTNGKKYFGWTVAKEGFVPTKEVFTTGEAFALAFRQGDVLAAPEGDEPKQIASNDGPERF